MPPGCSILDDGVEDGEELADRGDEGGETAAVDPTEFGQFGEEGVPVLDRGRCTNLWYNTGHGHMGWAMACDTARITADLIKGARPEIPWTA